MSSRLRILAAVLTIVTVLFGSQAAAFASGKPIGRINSASATEDSYACLTGCRSHAAWSDMHLTGWAVDKSTRPVQEVRFLVTGTVRHFSDKHPAGVKVRSSDLSPIFVARLSRKDIKRSQHLRSARVGFNVKYETNHYGYFIGKPRVCEYARNHGSHGSFTKVGCKRAAVH